ncbi:solute carrier family 2 member 11, like [Myripristis murdjan]|nr:solute carrier family 2, facilitated glucose transporter member 11-like [Myripristis murdjan]
MQNSYLQLESPGIISAILVSGIGGTFQYGFHISVMTSPSLFIKELVNKTCEYRYNLYLEQWQVSLIWSFIVSIFCIGGLLGALCGGRLASKYGRKQCLLMSDVLAIGGALLMVLSKTAISFEMIMVGRFIYGINSGCSLTVHMMYVVECAPKRLRGMVGVTAISFISFGKLCGQLLGISELLGTEDRWPWLLGFSGFTALLQLVTLPFLPESPRFLLLERGDHKGCTEAIRRLWGNKDYSVEVEEMLEEYAALQGVHYHTMMELIRNQTVRWQLLTVIVASVSLQLCGINAVYFYSYDVFSAAGIPEQNLRYAALGTGLFELFGSIVCFMSIESTGKRVLFFRGYVGMAVALGLLVITISLQNWVAWMPYFSMVFILIFIFWFAFGPAGVSGPLSGEIFAQSFKSAAYTISTTSNWLCLFFLGMLFPLMVEHLSYFCFLIFLCFCLFCAVFLRMHLPETKNKTVLEITAEFDRMHSKSRGAQKTSSNAHTPNAIQIYETKL